MERWQRRKRWQRLLAGVAPLRHEAQVGPALSARSRYDRQGRPHAKQRVVAVGENQDVQKFGGFLRRRRGRVDGYMSAKKVRGDNKPKVKQVKGKRSGLSVPWNGFVGSRAEEQRSRGAEGACQLVSVCVTGSVDRVQSKRFDVLCPVVVSLCLGAPWRTRYCKVWETQQDAKMPPISSLLHLAMCAPAPQNIKR